MRLNVRRTAGKENAIDARQDFADVERRLEHGDQQWQTVRRLHDGRDVFFTDGMKWMRTDHASVGGNAYDGSAAHKTLSREPEIRALSIIFYGIGPASGPKVAIRPHLTMRPAQANAAR